MNERRHQDLARMYQLFARVGGLDKLRIAFNVYIKKVGCSIVQDPEKDKTMVQDLLDFKSKLDFIMEESFQRNEIFQTSSKRSL